MFLSVSDLQHRDIDFDLELKPGELSFLDDQLRQATTLKAEGKASFRSSSRELFVRGLLTVVVSYPCDRCLEEVRFSVRRDFDLVYLPEDLGPVEDEREIGTAEVDIDFYRNGGIELNDVLREQVLLELPMRRVCEPVCTSEPAVRSAEASEADDRWTALKEYQSQREKKNR